MCKTEPAAKFDETDEINERQYSLFTYVKKAFTIFLFHMKENKEASNSFRKSHPRCELV